MSLAARLAWHRSEIQRLEQQQRAELLVTIRIVIGVDVVFSAAELFAHRVVSPALQTAFDDAGLRNARQLGKRLRQLRGDGLERVGDDWCGACWMVR